MNGRATSVNSVEIDPKPDIGELKSRSAAVPCRTEVCYHFGWKRQRRRQRLASIHDLRLPTR